MSTKETDVRVMEQWESRFPHSVKHSIVFADSVFLSYTKYFKFLQYTAVIFGS